MSKGQGVKKLLPREQSEELLKIMKARFEKHMSRHPGIEWMTVRGKLEANPEKLWSLNEMEAAQVFFCKMH